MMQNKKIYRTLKLFASQGTYSATTICILFACAHTAESIEFARISSLVLIIAILSTYTLQTVTQQLIAHSLISDASIIRQSIQQGAILGIVCSVYLYIISQETLNYIEIFLSFSSGSAFVVYQSHRRKLLLNGAIHRALAIDLGRMAIAGIYSGYIWSNGSTYFDFCIFLSASSTVPILFQIDLKEFRSKNETDDSLTLLHGDRLIIGSTVANATFSQATLLLAPAIVGTSYFAAHRSYEIILSALFFFIQALDPIYATAAKEWKKDRGVIPPKAAISAAVIFSPIFIIAVLELTTPSGYRPTDILIPEQYRNHNQLFWLIVLLSAIISMNCPIRWFMNSHRLGSASMGATVASSVTSMLVLFFGSRYVSPFALIVASKIAYEATNLICCGILIKINSQA